MADNIKVKKLFEELLEKWLEAEMEIELEMCSCYGQGANSAKKRINKLREKDEQQIKDVLDG